MYWGTPPKPPPESSALWTLAKQMGGQFARRIASASTPTLRSARPRDARLPLPLDPLSFQRRGEDSF